MSESTDFRLGKSFEGQVARAAGSVAVALYEPSAVARHAIGSALSDHGFSVLPIESADEMSADVSAWLCCVDDRGLELVVELLARAPSRFVIAVRDTHCASSVPQLLELVVTSVIDRDQSPLLLYVLAAQAATLGYALMPARRQTIEVGADREHPIADVSEDERTYLNHLATGTSIARIAQKVGYSERELHRRLARLYRKLGVQSKASALVVAATRGLIDSR